VSVREHALATPRREVGGLLVGEVYDREGRGFDVEVFAALPARGAVSGALQVTFGIAAWLELIQQRRQYPDARVVGWYHSHPGVGVFMSPTDRNLHEAFFSALPWYLALVVDPACDGFGVFARDDGVLVELARASTVPGSSEVAT
jgi:proteasome lid subunit RPN8/RPN11